MIPIIVEVNASGNEFSLCDAISCEVTKSASGEYTLSMTYPVNGVYADKIMLFNQIEATTSRASSVKEPFVITKIAQNISGIISVTANHKTYDFSKYPVRAFSESIFTPAEAISALYENSLKDPSGDVYATADASATKRVFGLSEATTWREALFGSNGLLETYGGVLYCTGKTVQWRDESTVGAAKGTIRYGLNLLKFKRTYDASDTYSHAYVFWSGESGFVECPELVQLGESSEFVRGTILNLSEYFTTVPSTEQLEAAAKIIAEVNDLTDVSTTLDISFVPLRLTDEYKQMTWLEEVDLYDKVAVEVPMFGEKSYARVEKTKFDVLAETYKSITVGTPRKSLDATLARLI